MAPGPPNLGDNRFSSLSDSPTRKKKKRQYHPFPIDFPELPEVTSNNPKFLVISTKNPEKPLSEYSCFAVHRELKTLSKDIMSISTLRDGNLLTLIKSKEAADKLSKATQLPGICEIQCKLHESLNVVKGTIYAPYLNNIPDQEIIDELKTQNVQTIFKFTKLVDGQPKPTGVILVSFDLYYLPKKLDISWHSVKVREYTPNPMRCKKCQLLGHTQKFCKNISTCVTCALPEHSPHPCTRTMCANCEEEHPASSSSCRKFIDQKEIIRLKTKNKCSLKEAKALFRQTQTQIPSTSTYAAAVASTSSSTTSKNKPNTARQSADVISSKQKAPQKNNEQIPSARSTMGAPTLSRTAYQKRINSPLSSSSCEDITFPTHHQSTESNNLGSSDFFSTFSTPSPPYVTDDELGNLDT